MDESYQVAEAVGSGIGSLISLALYVLIVIGNWKLFEKAGEDGWKSIIPFLNTYIMFKIVYGSGWKFLLLLVPILGEVLLIAYYIRLAQAYGKSTGFGIGMIFLTPIFYLMLAFDNNAQYIGPCTSFI